MRPHPRIRKTIKWGGAAVTVLLAGLWIHAVSEFLTTGGEPRDHGLWLFRRFWLSRNLGIACVLPPLSVCVVAVPTLLAWRLDFLASRHHRIGLCPTCGYDRAGLAAGAVCPECGAGGSGGSIA